MSGVNDHDIYARGYATETLVAARDDLSKRRLHGRRDPEGVWMIERLAAIKRELRARNFPPKPPLQ